MNEVWNQSWYPSKLINIGWLIYSNIYSNIKYRKVELKQGATINPKA